MSEKHEFAAGAVTGTCITVVRVGSMLVLCGEGADAECHERVDAPQPENAQGEPSIRTPSSETGLRESAPAPSAQPPAPESERGRLVRADDPESREWWRKVHEINDLPSNARLSHAESILRELAAYVAMPVIHGPDVLSLASQAHAFLADGSAHYEWHSESRLKGMRDVVRIAFESVGGGGYSAGRMCERLGITRGEGHRAGIQWLANAMTDLAESDYLAREATDALAVKVARPHQFEAGDYRCKVCGTPWRCHSDGTWSIRTSRLAERCCDDHPGFLLVMEKESE